MSNIVDLDKERKRRENASNEKLRKSWLAKQIRIIVKDEMHVNGVLKALKDAYGEKYSDYS